MTYIIDTCLLPIVTPVGATHYNFDELSPIGPFNPKSTGPILSKPRPGMTKVAELPKFSRRRSENMCGKIWHETGFYPTVCKLGDGVSFYLLVK